MIQYYFLLQFTFYLNDYCHASANSMLSFPFLLSFYCSLVPSLSSHFLSFLLSSPNGLLVSHRRHNIMHESLVKIRCVCTVCAAHL